MPFDIADLHRRGIPAKRQQRELNNIRFDDLLYLTAEGIAEAQTKLDLNTAEVLETLAATEIENLPRSVTRTITSDGTVDIDTDTETVSLLELGFTPTRYQFSETTIELNLDLRISEETTTNEEREGQRYGIYGGTYEITEERKYDRTVESNASVKATLEPVPLPVELSPAETYERENSSTE